MTNEQWIATYGSLNLFDSFDYTKKIIDTDGEICYRVTKFFDGFVLQILNPNTKLTQSALFISYKLPA